MQGYSQGFAYIYNTKWANFAEQIAPFLIDYYSSKPLGKTNKSVLDLCCGAGHLAVRFLEKGFRVVGVDLSEHMLKYARENTDQYLESGQAEFKQADASDFTLTEKFGLVVSTYDSLNHLPNEESLINCFKCVYEVCDGYFIFDLNTRKGLKNWNNTTFDECSEDALIISRGIFDGQSDKAWMRITGFISEADGLYRRFDETVYNTVFNMASIKNALLEIGWKHVHFARIKDLAAPLAEPEEEGRVFIVAAK